jgi:hypothetical protein
MNHSRQLELHSRPKEDGAPFHSARFPRTLGRRWEEVFRIHMSHAVRAGRMIMSPIDPQARPAATDLIVLADVRLHREVTAVLPLVQADLGASVLPVGDAVKELQIV